MPPQVPRPDITALSAQTFDVLVIGGGINGAGVAHDAATRGMSVCLVEQNDFASGTSSRSSKLVHGGMRYLAHGDFRLVHEACRERRRLLHLAPHLVEPVGFLIPIFEDYEWGMAAIRAGMLLYDTMAMFRNVHPHRMLNARRVRGMEPLLNPEGLRGGALYYDCRMDDARLCLENVLSAREAGAVCLNYVRVRSLIHSGGQVVGAEVEDLETGRTASVRAHVVLNTAGVWVDDISALDGAGAKRKVRPTKGTHIIVRPFVGERAVVVASERDGRMFFVIPWREYTMIGTTDTDHAGAAGPVYATAADVEYLLTETQRLFPTVSLMPDQVISTYAGLRPLMNQEGMSESAVSREHVIFESPSGVISMVGGKYTTYRSQAAEVVDQTVRRLYPRKFRPCMTQRVPVYGGHVGDFEWYCHEQTPLAARQFGVEPRLVDHLIRQYGGRYRDVLRVILRDPDYRLPLSDSGDFVRGEVVYQAEVECARSICDVLQRRTQLHLTVGNGLDCADTVADLLAHALDWNTERRAAELTRYAREVALTQAWRDEFQDMAGREAPSVPPAVPVSPA